MQWLDNGQNAAPCWCIAFAESALGSVGFYVGQQSVCKTSFLVWCALAMSLEWIQFLSKNNLLTVTYFILQNKTVSLSKQIT